MMPLMRRVNKVREIRKALGISAYDLQAISSINAQSIYLIERGLKKPLPYEKALLAEALKVPIEELFPADLERNREVIKY